VQGTRTKLRNGSHGLQWRDTTRREAQTSPWKVHILLEAQWKTFFSEQRQNLNRWMEWLSQPKGAEGHAKGMPKQAPRSAAPPSQGKLSR
jgi:hypothetical protein